MKGSCKQAADQHIAPLNSAGAEQHTEKEIPIHTKWQEKV